MKTHAPLSAHGARRPLVSVRVRPAPQSSSAVMLRHALGARSARRASLAAPFLWPAWLLLASHAPESLAPVIARLPGAFSIHPGGLSAALAFCVALLCAGALSLAIAASLGFLERRGFKAMALTLAAFGLVAMASTVATGRAPTALAPMADAAALVVQGALQ